MTRTHFEEPPIEVEPSVQLALMGKTDPKTVHRRSSFFPPSLAGSFLEEDDGSSSLSDRSFEQSLQQVREHEKSLPVAVETESESDDAVSTCSLDDDAVEDATTAQAELPENEESTQDHAAFMSLRVTYLIVTLVIMLADGLQGTHLYVLYDGYGFPVATLYALGFVAGGLASPITGPLVDKLGRKKSAILYCVLEIFINMLEQYPILAGLIVSRMVGGITTNLLSTVFDTWLDTEYRRRGLHKGGYEIIMRDSVIVSNLAAIGSGYLAHVLAEKYGPVGPFEGAVTFTSIALIVVMFVWTENYGCEQHQVKGMTDFMQDAVDAFQADRKVFRLGIIQGLTCASIQIFIFLWSPALQHFAQTAPKGSWGLDSHGEPAYGLIFGAFMAAGVCGGLAAPWIRRFVTNLVKPAAKRMVPPTPGLAADQTDGEQTNDDRPKAVEVLASGCYMVSAVLLLIPCLLAREGTHSFSICVGAFLIYEFMVGLYLPCEGVLRSIYFPAEGRASILTLPRIIVNGAVSFGVVATNFITIRSAFSVIFGLMAVSTALQLSLISVEDWAEFLGKTQDAKDAVHSQCAFAIHTVTGMFSEASDSNPLVSLSQALSPPAFAGRGDEEQKSKTKHD